MDYPDTQSDFFSFNEEHLSSEYCTHLLNQFSELISIYIDDQEARDECTKKIQQIKMCFTKNKLFATSLENQLLKAQDEIEVRSEQLTHVQEELENYFIMNTCKTQLLSEYDILYKRYVEALIKFYQSF